MLDKGGILNCIIIFEKHIPIKSGINHQGVSDKEQQYDYSCKVDYGLS